MLALEPGAPQLFVDDHLIERSRGLRRTLHRPVKDGGGLEPVIALGDEYGDLGATLEANGTIVWDPRLERWVMFALALASARRGRDRARLYRFTSRDGIAWTKGADGRPEQIVFDLTDPRTGASATGIDLFACHYDASEERHPYRGWLYNWGGPLEGVYFVRSADGRTWERGRRVVAAESRWLVQDGRVLHGPGDVTIFSPDPGRGRHLALLKFFSPRPVEHRSRLRSRAFMWVEHLDDAIDLDRLERVDLVPPAAEVDGDRPHDEYYASTAWRYGEMWLGGLKIWHRDGDHPHSAAGCAFLKLASSRDGLCWEKVPFAGEDGVPEVWIPNGEEGGGGGRADGGYLTEFSQGPLRIGDELVHYYGCSSLGKNHPAATRLTGGGIYRARLRLDGFVSVDAGTIETPALTLPGGGLRVNAVGPVTVELVGAAGETLGTSRVDGDSVRHAVRLPAPEGAARLRFAVEPGGRLYSFSAG